MSEHRGATSVAVPGAQSVVVGRRASSRPGVVRVALFTLATLVSVPVAVLLTFTGIGIFSLVIPLVLSVAAARKNASLFYPEVRVTMPPEPVTVHSSAEIVVSVAPGRDVFDRVELKVRAQYNDRDNESQFPEHTALVISRPCAGKTERIAVRDVLAPLNAPREAKYVLRVQGYVKHLPDAAIDVAVRIA